METSEESFDVVVVGAGPAGSTCALHLARAGRHVALLDAVEAPRYKACGGGLVRRCVRNLDVEFGAQVEREVCRVGLNLRDARMHYEVERDHSIVSMTMRSSLDAALLAAARHAGALFMAPQALTALRQDEEFVRVETSGRAMKTRYVVAADGAAGPTARLAQFGPHRRIAAALESEVSVDSGTFERFRDAAMFDFGLVPGGYAWVFPKRRHLSIGCLSVLPGRRGLRNDLEKYLELLQLGSCERTDHGFVIPIAVRARGLARGRVLLTGDSAGLADPITLEGIGNAIESGRLAAQAIEGLFEEPEAVAACYQRVLEGEILPELRIASRLSWALYGLPRVRTALFRRLGQPLAEAMTSVMLGEQSYRSLLTSPGNWGRAIRGILKPNAA